MDAGQLLYHIAWPNGGTVSTIAASIGAKLQPYNAVPTTVVFDRYGNVSAKDHERERRATGVCGGTYNLTLTSPLPNREDIMKSKANKRLLSRLLCTCTLAPNILMVGEDEGLFNHEEAAVLMVCFMIDAIRYGKKVIRILNDDTDVFVILIFWVRKLSTTKALVQMENGMELCCTSITLWLLSRIEVSSFLECTPSQVVIQCLIPSTRESSPHSANSEKETSHNCTTRCM